MDPQTDDVRGARSRPVVLVVARSPQAVDVARDALGAASIVLGASSGARAIALAAQEPHPDLVVLDEQLPDMAALAVLEALHREPHTRAVPVIFTGTQATFDGLSRFTGRLADFIAQPVGAEVLQARVRLHLDRLRLHQELRQRSGALQREIERRAEVEAALRKATADLGALSYGVSHDLRASVSAILAFASSLVPERAGLSAKGQHRLERIVAISHRLSDTVDDVLRYSGSGEAQMLVGSVDIARIVHDVVAELGEGMDIRFTVEPLPRVRGDAAMLRQIVENLIGNAVKFSACRADAQVEVRSRAAGGSVQIVVSDNGVGFDTGYRDKLFRLFQRLHPQTEFPGTGVGLAIVKRLVERHGGEVCADSVAGGWTTFGFTVPLCRQCCGTGCAAGCGCEAATR